MTIRHSTLRQRAKWIDQFIYLYNLSRHRRNLPRKQTGQLVELLYPGSRHLGRGAFKNAFHIKSIRRDLVLKLSTTKEISKDAGVYRKLPRTIRNRYFAKVYWYTRDTMLQKYGTDGRIPPKRLEKLREVARKYGLKDVRILGSRLSL